MYGNGTSATSVIVLKPQGPGLDTNLLIDAVGSSKYPEEKLEKLSVADALNAVRFAEVVVVLLDVENAFEEQDQRIAGAEQVGANVAASWRRNRACPSWSHARITGARDRARTRRV